MEKSQIKQVLLPSFVLVLTLGAVSKPLAEASRIDSVLAQSVPTDALPVPAAVPNGTTVKIDGSSSTIATNQTFKQRFEKKFSNNPSCGLSNSECFVTFDSGDRSLQSWGCAMHNPNFNKR